MGYSNFFIDTGVNFTRDLFISLSCSWSITSSGVYCELPKSIRTFVSTLLKEVCLVSSFVEKKKFDLSDFCFRTVRLWRSDLLASSNLQCLSFMYSAWKDSLLFCMDCSCSFLWHEGPPQTFLYSQSYWPIGKSHLRRKRWRCTIRDLTFYHLWG